LLAVRRRVAGTRMNDGEVAHQANFDVLRLQILDRDRQGGLLQKGSAIDQRFVGIGTIEILSKDLVKTSYVGILSRIHVIEVEAGQFGNIVSHDFFLRSLSSRVRRMVLNL